MLFEQVKFAVIVFCLCLVGWPAQAVEPVPALRTEPMTFRAKDVIRLSYGANFIDLDGDGHKDLIIRYRWSDKATAGYLYDQFQFLQFIPRGAKQVRVPGLAYPAPWRQMAVLKRGSTPSWNYLDWGTGPDGECVRYDLRLIARDGGRQPPLVLRVEVGRGENRFDPDWVVFTVYEPADLQRYVDLELDTGIYDGPDPRSGYVPVQTWRSRKKYCDVGAALRREVYRK
jgi:hypothetical protein